jgi:cytochrome oxidase Cu insertion factor (SCO1/SenC/PrrC family)
MSENVRVNRSKLWLLGAVCVAPIVASYIAFYMSPPGTRTNYGELLETRRLPEAVVALVDGTPFSLSRLRGKWLLLSVDAGTCGDYCRRKLFNMRQLRLAQGKDMERIERVWLISDNAPVPKDVAGEFHGTWLLRAAGSELLGQLPAEHSASDYLYLVDPLGNLVLRYGRDSDPVKIIKDLTRLLKVSGIG